MITILKGDTSAPITVALAAGYDYSGRTVNVSYQGVTRAFRDVQDGDALSFMFSAEETAPMAVGTWPVQVFITDDNGGFTKVKNSGKVRIRVTDDPSEVYAGDVIAVGGTGLLYGLKDLPERYTDKDVVNKLREILRRGGAVLCALLAFGLSAATVHTAPKEDIYNDAPVVTNVTFEGLATLQDLAAAGNVTPQTVTNIVTDLGQQFGKVKSVNGKTGAVSLSADDVGALPGNEREDGSYYINASLATPGYFEALGGISVYGSAYVNGKQIATENDIGAVSNRVESLGTTVNAWQTYWDGDDVRLTVTNYYGSLDIPSLYLEQKMPADDGHDAPWFRVVWDERTRWNTFMPAFTAVTNEVQQNKADRAWGVYDSSTGAYSPDGLLQVSQEQIMIASGMAWQKTITAGGCAVWVLKATNPTTLSGETENGYFRIQDGDGNPIFEVVKGDKRVVGAVATDIQVSGGTMTVRYNSVSDEHPTMEVCTDLLTPDWQTEDACTVARVTWGGSSGAWVATVTPIGAPRSMFARATFEAGGNTYIRNHVASSLDKVVVGGREYTVTVENVGGKNLMVLK